MAKISKSAKMKKGSQFGEEQFQELARTFFEKTGAIEKIFDSKGQFTGVYKVKEEFKMVMEIDTKDIRSDVPEPIDNYLKFKDNTVVRSVTTRVNMTDPGDNENVNPPTEIDEEDDKPYYVGQLLVDPKKANEVEVVNPPIFKKKNKKK